MATLSLNYDEAHQFVSNGRRNGIDVRWDGWEMVIWKPTHYGFTNKKGAYRRGRWGMESRVTVSEKGTWEVPAKDAKPIR